LSSRFPLTLHFQRVGEQMAGVLISARRLNEVDAAVERLAATLYETMERLDPGGGDLPDVRWPTYLRIIGLSISL
jgi:hypothetical protein